MKAVTYERELEMKLAEAQAECVRLRDEARVADEQRRVVVADGFQALELQASRDRLIAEFRGRADKAEARVAELERERDEAVALLAKVKARRFPVMDGPSVLWSFVAPHEEQAKRNHEQSLQRLAERGGLDPGELYAVCHGLRWSDIRALDKEATKAWLLGVVAAEDETKRDLAAARELLRDVWQHSDAINPHECVCGRGSVNDFGDQHPECVALVARVRALLGTDGSGG